MSSAIHVQPHQKGIDPKQHRFWVISTVPNVLLDEEDYSVVFSSKCGDVDSRAPEEVSDAIEMRRVCDEYHLDIDN